MKKIPIGISSCLLGQEVRYDGGHKYHSYIDATLGQFFEFKSFCPEMVAGLGVPRPAVQLRNTADGIRALGIKDRQLDVTQQLQEAGQQLSATDQLCGYILKKDSPSCGMERVKVYTNDVPARVGVGLFAAYLQQHFPDLPIEEEGRLGDPRLRENFIQRVFITQRWHVLNQQGLTVHGLMRFHSQHKLIAMSHEQNLAHKLGRLVAEVRPDTLYKIAPCYFSELMICLKIVATRGNHVNVLQHIQGYLKNRLDADDKKELVEVIEDYRQEKLPLIVPLTLLRHHFRRQPDAFITGSYYMYPHPEELCLLNEL